MYLFPEKEAELISRIVNQDSPTVRGWDLNIQFKNLLNLNISNIMSNFCRTDRKIFQLFKGVEYGSSSAMIMGATIHSIVEKIYERVNFERAAPNLNSDSLLGLKDENKLEEIIWAGGKLQELRNLSKSDGEYERTLSNLRNTMGDIVDFEISRFSDSGFSNEVELVDLERYVSGFHLGTRNGKIDAIFRYRGKLGIGDLKTGKPWNENIDAKLQIAIYALLLESEIKLGIDWGVVVFPFEVNNGRKCIREEPLKDIFEIDDELRLKALQRLRNIDDMLHSEIPPEVCFMCNTRTLCSKEI